MKLKYLCHLILLSVLATSCSKEKISTKDNYEVVDLPDGSIVILNHYSELEYLEAFNDRKIAISGEAYFSVEPSDKSFTVVGHLGEVEVLGTAFSVKSNVEDMQVEVEKGEVEFKVDGQSKNVSSGQLASYQKGSDSIKTGKATVSFKKWMAKLRVELKRFDKDLNKELSGIEKKLNNKAKEIEKEAGKIGKELDKVGKQIGKSIEKVAD